MSKYFLKYPKSSIPRARELRRKMTDSDRKLWSLLRRKQLGVHFRKQVPYGPFILDFLSIKGKLSSSWMAVNISGTVHSSEMPSEMHI